MFEHLIRSCPAGCQGSPHMWVCPCPHRCPALGLCYASSVPAFWFLLETWKSNIKHTHFKKAFSFHFVTTAWFFFNPVTQFPFALSREVKIHICADTKTYLLSISWVLCFAFHMIVWLSHYFTDCWPITDICLQWSLCSRSKYCTS